ncbi:MAG: tetratricopeptide repeat protein [Nitrospinota bacterium]
MILLKDEATARKVAELLAQGKAFADLASQYSIDPTKERGGFLGRVALNNLNEQVRAMVGSLKVGGFTGPVRVQNGLAFFQRTTTAHYSEALQLMRSKKFSEALDPLGKDLSLNPDRVHSLTLRAYALQRLDRSKEAKEAYRRILKRDPKNVLSYNNLGTLLDQEGNYAEAAKMFERAIALKPKQDVILHNLAWIYSARLEQPSKALAFIRKAIALKADAANYHAMLGDIYRRLGNRQKAREAVKKAADLEPQNQEYRQTLAKLGNSGTSLRPKKAAARRASSPVPRRERKRPIRTKPASPPSKPGQKDHVAAVNPPARPSIKIVTRIGGANTSRMVGRLLKENEFPVARRLRESKPLNGIRIYYKPPSIGAARKIRDLISPRPELRRLTWKSQFDIIVYVGK